MIKLAGNLANETIARHPSFQYLLPEKERMGDLMDKAVNNFYIVGRNWITSQVRLDRSIDRPFVMFLPFR